MPPKFRKRLPVTMSDTAAPSANNTRPKKTAADFQRVFEEMVRTTQISLPKGFALPELPVYKQPKLPMNLSERPDDSLMSLFVRLTRWTDYLAGQTTVEEVKEREADALVKRLENLYMLRHRAALADDGVKRLPGIDSLKMEMDDDEEIYQVRLAHRVAKNRRTMMKMLFEHAERDAAVCSRELTRRTSTMADSIRRVDRHTA
jgi:hypothetical protein